MTKTPLISIIMPAYNVETYIADSIKSILNQSYNNLELIIINDGSTDDTKKIAQSFSVKDKRVRLFSTKNYGVSHARNFGLHKSRGELISFIDSDDQYTKNALMIMIQSLIKYGADISTSRYISVTNFDNHIESIDKFSSILNPNDVLKDFFYDTGHITGSICAKIYKKNIIENILFDETLSIAEDQDFFVKVLNNAHMVVHNSIIGYLYLKRNNSAVNSPFNKEHVSSIKLGDKLLAKIPKEDSELKKACKNYLFRSSIIAIFSMPAKKSQFKHEYDLCILAIKQNRKTVLLDEDSKIIYRLYALVSFLGVNFLFNFIKFRKLIGTIKRELLSIVK